MKALSRFAVLTPFLSTVLSLGTCVMAAMAAPSSAPPSKQAALSSTLKTRPAVTAGKPAAKPASKPVSVRTPQPARSSGSSSPAGQAAATAIPAQAAPAMVTEPAPSSGGSTVVLQDFSMMDSSVGGSWKDEKGSRMEYTFKDAEKRDYPDDKMLSAKYRQVPGGWCGIWYRAGDTWDAVDCSNPTALLVKMYSKKPLVLGFSMEDENKNKLDLQTPKTQGGKWEVFTIPIAAVSKDFKMIRVFNMYMNSGGSEGVFAIDWIKVVKK